MDKTRRVTVESRIDKWLVEAGGHPYVDEEAWEECARQIERELIATRKAFDEACYELRPFGAYAQTIERWEADIRSASSTIATSATVGAKEA